MSIATIINTHAAHMEQARREFEKMYLDLHRQGGRFPSAEQVAKIIYDLLPAAGIETDSLDPGAACLFQSVLTGLSGLLQLSIVQERM